MALWPVTEYSPSEGRINSSVRPEGSRHVFQQLYTGNVIQISHLGTLAMLYEKKSKDHSHLVAGYHHNNLTPK